jgi:hypothetical protein
VLQDIQQPIDFQFFDWQTPMPHVVLLGNVPAAPPRWIVWRLRRSMSRSG